MNITPEAATAIQSLLSDRQGGGLRIFPTENEGDGGRFEIKLTLSEQPDPTDEVIAQHGSQVFVEQQLSSMLTDKTLDVSEVDDDRRVGFRLVS